MNNRRVDPNNKQRDGGSALIKELYMIEEEGESPVKGEINERGKREGEGREGKGPTTVYESTDVIVRTPQRDLEYNHTQM